MCWLHHTTKFSFHYAFPMSSYLRVETLWTIKSSQTCNVAAHLKVTREHFHLFCFFSYFISSVLRVFIIHFLLYPLLNLGSPVIKKTDVYENGSDRSSGLVEGDAVMWNLRVPTGAVRHAPPAW